MNVLVVEPGYAPYEKEVDGLAEEQAVVGGTISVIYPFQEQVGIVCNDDALSLGLPFNRSVEGGYGAVCGTFFICGLGEEDFCSLTQEQVKRYKQKFHKAEMLLAVNGSKPVTAKVEPRRRDRPPQNKSRDTLGRD